MEALPIQAGRGLQQLMSDYAAANLWANRRHADWLRQQPAGLLEQPVPSSFPGIKSTLVHIWDAERFWIAVLQERRPYPSFRGSGFEGTMEEVFEGLIAQSAALEQYVHSLDEAAFLQEKVLDTAWAKGSRPQYDFIQHCISHSAYHRGQIVTMSHQLGITGAPITDYNAFLMFPG